MKRALVIVAAVDVVLGLAVLGVARWTGRDSNTDFANMLFVGAMAIGAAGTLPLLLGLFAPGQHLRDRFVLMQIADEDLRRDLVAVRRLESEVDRKHRALDYEVAGVAWMAAVPGVLLSLVFAFLL